MEKEKGIKQNEKHIKLMQEKINSLDNFQEICVYEDEEKDIKVFIKIPENRENIFRSDILERYNNMEYWNQELWDEEENTSESDS